MTLSSEIDFVANLETKALLFKLWRAYTEERAYRESEERIDLLSEGLRGKSGAYLIEKIRQMLGSIRAVQVLDEISAGEKRASTEQQLLYLLAAMEALSSKTEPMAWAKFLDKLKTADKKLADQGVESIAC